MKYSAGKYDSVKGVFLDDIPAMVFIMHRDGTVLEIHGADPEKLTAPVNELIGININSSFDKDEVDRHLQIYNDCIKSKQPGQVKYKLYINNKELYFESKIKALDNDRVITVVRDITQQTEMIKAYQDELAYRQFLFENSKDGLVVIDCNHKVIDSNLRIREMLGYSADELLKLHTWDFDALSNEDTIRTKFSLEGEINSVFESRHRRKDGSFYDVEVSAKNFTWKGERIVFCCCRDISKRKMLERENQRALQEADAISQRFEQIAEHVGEIIWETDTNGVYIYLNRAATTTLGYSQEELVGKMSCFDLMPENEREHLKKLVFKMFEKREPIVNLENNLIAKDGKRISVITNGIPVISMQGELLGYRGSDRDVTEEKKHKDQLQLSEEKYRILVENLHAGIVIHHPDSSIMYANQRAANLLGLSIEQLKGRVAYDPEWRFVDSDGKRLSLEEYPISRVISSGRHIADEIFGIDRPVTNDRTWVQINAFPEFDAEGNVVQIVVTFIDITEQKRLYQDLLISKYKADESNRLKSAFINNISHEVRTPLNGILGFVDIIMEDEQLRKSKEYELSILDISSKRLQKTIENIIEISELNAGSVVPKTESFNLSLMMTELIERTAIPCSKRSIWVNTEFPAGPNDFLFCTDPDLLKKALWQLLDNAVKFTDKGSITLGFTVEDEQVTIFVRDTGKGISQDMLSVIFDPFTQEDVSSTRGYEGSGLGLPIAKGVAELLGGSIFVESQKGRGSKFSLAFPLNNLLLV